jgi:hypothetical protein
VRSEIPMAFVAYCGHRSSRPRAWVYRILASLVLAAAAAAPERPVLAADQIYPTGETIKVYLDQALLLKLPERTATLVVGNPLIADVSVQTGGMLVVTGKGYGVTNLIALDRTGVTTMEHPIEVVGPRGQTVMVYRGIERETYSCSPNCERRITLGDTPSYFSGILTQAGSISALASGSGAPPSK